MYVFHWHSIMVNEDHRAYGLLDVLLGMLVADAGHLSILINSKPAGRTVQALLPVCLLSR